MTLSMLCLVLVPVVMPMNEINAVKLKMKMSLLGKRDSLQKQIEDDFWSLVDVIGTGNAVNFVLGFVETALDEIMKTDETN